MNIETDDWGPCPRPPTCSGSLRHESTRWPIQALVESVRPWPHIRPIGRRSVAEQLGGDTATRVSRGAAMCRIAGRHGVTGHPVRHDRITAEVNRVMAGIDPKDLHSELYEFITETRPHWSESRRTAYATDLAAHIRPPTSPRAT